MIKKRFLSLSFTLFCISCFFFFGSDDVDDLIDHEIGDLIRNDGFEFGIFFLSISFLALLKSLYSDNLDHSINSKSERQIFFSKQNTQFGQINNKIKTTRYTWLSIFPLILFEYIIDTSNIYFEVVCILQVFTTWSPTGKHSTYPGLIVAFVGKCILIVLEELKRAWDDWSNNSRLYQKLGIHSKESRHFSKKFLEDVKCGDIKPGDIIFISDGSQIPVDGILLGSSDGPNMAVLSKEAALTGETAPTEKFPIDLGINMDGLNLEDIDAVLNRYGKFFGNLKGYIECGPPSSYPLDFKGSIYSNKGENILEFSHTNSLFRGSILQGSEWVLMCAVYTGAETKLGQCFERTPLKKTLLDIQLERSIRRWNFTLIGLLITLAVTVSTIISGKHVGTWEVVKEIVVNFLALNGLNNLSMQLIGDIVRMGQCYQITQNPNISVMVNRNIPDALGQVEVIISDKTGTLTQNKLKCVYVMTSDNQLHNVKSLQFLNELESSLLLQEFIECMALCNKVIPKLDHYFSANPDDEEFVKRAFKSGCRLVERYREGSAEKVVLHTRWAGEKNYTIMQVHEFDSSRKYMSVIIKYDGKLKLLLKGANRVIYDKLDPEDHQRVVEGEISQRIHKLSSEGLRVLVWAIKDLDESEFDKWNNEYIKIQQKINNEHLLEDMWRTLEQNVKFLGATAVDDRLQDGAADTLTYAQRCGIKVVMATGDACSTAVAIWNKLGQVQGQLTYLIAADESGRLSQEKILDRFNEIYKGNTNDVFVTDGEVLNLVLKMPYRSKLKNILNRFSSVVAARISAIQKAELTSIYRELNLVTLCIGDGGNDVTMIQRAHIGIGLDSKETDAAARAADFRSLKFSYLKHLLVHGAQNYTRLATVYLWNDYKALILALVPYISRAFNGFKGDSLVPGDIIFVLTTILLAYPVIMFGILDVPLDEEELLNNPEYYALQRGKQFNQKKKFLWWLSALIHVFVIIQTTKYCLQDYSLLVKGVVAGQMISIVGNIRLFLESRQGFKTLATWNFLLISACMSSIILFLPIARINLLFDPELRKRIGGTTTLPELDPYNVLIASIAGFICLFSDLIIYKIAGHDGHLLTSRPKLKYQ